MLASFLEMHSSDGAVDHADLVRGIAVRTMASLGLRDRIDDAVNDGHEALLQAKLAFDPDRGVPFEAYAAYRVRWAVLEGVRKMASASHVHRLRRAMAAADVEAERAGIVRGERGEPSRDEASLESIEGFINNLATVFSAVEVGEAAQHGAAEDSVVTELDVARLRRALTRLDEDERQLLFHVYFEGISVLEAAEAMRKGRSQAYALHTRALASLRVLLV